MALSARQLEGLDVLLNESVLLDAEVDATRRRLALTFYVEMVPETGDRHIDDLYLQLVLEPIRRLAASLRYGSGWTDGAARVEEFALSDLGPAVRRIRNHDAIFGWRFFDVPEDEGFDEWRHRLSLDFCTEDGDGRSHTLTVWSEDLLAGSDTDERPLLDLRVWFDDLSIRNRNGEQIDVDDAIAAGRRYWERVATRGSGGPSPYPVPYVSIPLPPGT